MVDGSSTLESKSSEPRNGLQRYGPLLEMMKLEYQSLRREIEASISKHFQIPVFQLFALGISAFVRASTDTDVTFLAAVLIVIITPTLAWWGSEQHRMMRAASYLRELEARINRLFGQWYENEPHLGWVTALGWENWIIPSDNRITSVLAKNVHEILFLVGVGLVWLVNFGLTCYVSFKILYCNRPVLLLSLPILFATIEVALAPYLFIIPLHRKPALGKRLRKRVHQHIKQYHKANNEARLNLPDDLKSHEQILIVFDFNEILFSTNPNQDEKTRLRYRETSDFVNTLGKIDARIRTAIVTGNSYINVFRHLSARQ